MLSGTELNSDHAIKKVASPPNPLKRATISGIEVIFTFNAISDPTIAPTPMPAKIKNGFTWTSGSKKVIKTAMNIANADSKFPFTAVSSLPSIFIPVINKIDAAIYIKF